MTFFTCSDKPYMVLHRDRQHNRKRLHPYEIFYRFLVQEYEYEAILLTRSFTTVDRELNIRLYIYGLQDSLSVC
jgi:hypothetical protein